MADREVSKGEIACQAASVLDYLLWLAAVPEPIPQTEARTYWNLKELPTPALDAALKQLIGLYQPRANDLPAESTNADEIATFLTAHLGWRLLSEETPPPTTAPSPGARVIRPMSWMAELTFLPSADFRGAASGSVDARCRRPSNRAQTPAVLFRHAECEAECRTSPGPQPVVPG